MKIETAIVAIESLRDAAVSEHRKLSPWSEAWGEAWARADAYTLALDLLDGVEATS
jgi:hypothetical protein